MDVSALFLIILTIVGIAAFVSWPVLKHWRIQQTAAGQELSTLLAERDRILKEIQELDFDYSLGKIPAGEYPVQRQVLLHSGAEILRQIDAMRPSRSEPVFEDQGSARIQLEAAMEAPGDRITDEDLEMLIAERRASRREKTGGFCPKCGKPFMQSDQFCSCCGQPLGVQP